MPAVFQRQPLVIALAGIAVLLAVVLAAETGFGTRMGPALPGVNVKPAAPPEAKLLPALTPTNADQLYPETTARPLFIATRRPAPPAETAQQSAMKRGQFVLHGVIIAGNTKIAMLREKANGRIHRVERGQEINGMKLAEVLPESVTLAQGSEQEVLPLQVLRAGAPGQPPVAAPAATGPFPSAAPVAPPVQPSLPNPLVNPMVPGVRQGSNAPNPNVSNANALGFGPMVTPNVPTTSAPISPEELLARRHARRTQQPQ